MSDNPAARTGEGSGRSSGWMPAALLLRNGGCDQLMDRRTCIGSLALGILAVPRVAAAQPATQGVSDRDPQLPGMTSSMVGPQPREPFHRRAPARVAPARLCVWRALRDRATGGRGQARALPRPRRRAGPSQVDLIVLAGHTPATRAQGGDLDAPDRHGWRRRPRGPGARPEPRTTRAGTSRG